MSGGGTTKQTQTTESSPWEAQIPYLQQLLSEAQNWYNNGGIQTWSGQRIADMDPTRMQGQDSLLGAANSIGGMLGGVNEAWQFALTNALDPESNPYLRASAQAAGRNVTEQFNEQILPSLRLNSIQGNNFNSTRTALAEGMAAGKIGQALADLNTNMYNNAYNTGMQSMMGALQMSPMLANLQLMPGQIQSQVGQERQAYDQALLDAMRAQFQEEQMNPMQSLQFLQSIIGQQYGGGSSTSTQTQTTPGPSNAQLALGLGALGLGAYGMFAGGLVNPLTQMMLGQGMGMFGWGGPYGGYSSGIGGVGPALA